MDLDVSCKKSALTISLLYYLSYCPEFKKVKRKEGGRKKGREEERKEERAQKLKFSKFINQPVEEHCGPVGR